VARITKFNPVNNGSIDYDGVAGSTFQLLPGEAYYVQLKSGQANRSYIVVGSHDPSKVVEFKGQSPGISATGQNFYAWPYHSTSNDAGELITELGGTAVIQRVTRFNVVNNGSIDYDGIAGTAFPLLPGEGYFVQLKTGIPTVQFIPSHF
jgi:hypothetical protein